MHTVKRLLLLCGVLLVLAAAAQAQITIVQSKEGAQTGQSFTSSFTNGNAILVMYHMDTFFTCSGITTGQPTDSNSNTYAQAGSDQCSTAVSGSILGIWYVCTSSASPGTIVGHGTAGERITIVEVSGLLTSGCYDTASGANVASSGAANTDYTITSLTTAVANELIVVETDVNSGTPAPGTNFTLISQVSTWMEEYRVVTTATSYNILAKTSGTNQAASGVAAAFKPAGGTAPARHQLLRN